MGGVRFQDFGIEVPPGRTGNVKVQCPKCVGGRTHRFDKSLSVHVEKGIWKCHHCGWAGGTGQTDWRDSIGRRDTPRIYTKPEPIPSDLAPGVIRWFGERLITQATLERNRISGNGKAIQFPYYRDGELVNVKTRYPNKRFSMVADAERIFYGLDDCTADDAVIIVEGEIDKLSVEEAGFLNCLSVPDGAPSPSSSTYTAKFTFMDSGLDLFARCHTVVLAVDNDAPGRKLEEELARRIGREKCFRVSWPDGCKDANDVLMQHGSDVLRDCLMDGRPYPISGVVMALEILPDVLSLYRTGSQRGVSTGWTSLDHLYTVKPGQMTIVTGIPGSGKSEWLDALMVNIAQEDGWSFAVFSPENFPPQRHLQKWLEKLTGKPFRDGPTARMTEADIESWMPFLDQHLHFIMPDEPTLDEILSLFGAMVYQRGTKGIVLDPWNEIDHSRPREMSETEYISLSLSKIRQFCRHYDVHGWVSAHPRMLQKDKVSGEYSVPTPYEIAGSAHWYNKSDNCISIWRNKVDDDAPVEVHVQKIRFREIGALGTAYLTYDRVTGEYHDTSEWHYAGGKR
jgi:twinkle protein